MSMAEAVTSSADDFKVLAWRNYVRRLEGEEALISTMDNNMNVLNPVRGQGKAKAKSCRFCSFPKIDDDLETPKMQLHFKTDFH